MLLTFHILAGLLGLLSGYTALYAAKGAPRHRQAGMLFVYAMLPMSISGMLIAAVYGVAPQINVPAALVTFYLVTTALFTVRPPAERWQWLERAAMLLAFTLVAASLAVGVRLAAAGGARAGMAFPLFIFALVALIGAMGDRRLLRSGGIHGARRLARHLWRMCFALFVAAGSFFLGQADEFPSALRIMPLLAIPVLAVPTTMVYWLWRLRAGKATPSRVQKEGAIPAFRKAAANRPIAGHRIRSEAQHETS